MDPQEHLNHLRTRRTRRVYSNQVVPMAAIERALEAGTFAPSGANSQPWEFLLIPQGPQRDAIREMCRKADERFHETAPKWLKDWLKEHHVSTEKLYFDDAPWLLCVFAARNLPYWLPSVWLCVSNIVNQIHAEGLHSVVYTPTLGRDFNELVGVDREWSFQVMLPIGYAVDDEAIVPRPRKLIAEKTKILGPDGPIPFDGRDPYLSQVADTHG